MENIKTERVKIGEWDAITFFDEEEKLHTITFAGKGGAIISNANYEKAKNDFIEAMRLAESVMKLEYFKEHGTFPPKT